ncbi:MAG: class I SAM-dependent methyltransferase [Parvibaculum sp.]|nr:class I SAM-dependent methyltransferase [Parvibaculum sp.]
MPHSTQSRYRPNDTRTCGLARCWLRNGSFALAAEEFGYRALGIDISAEGVEFAVSRGANARNLDFLTYNFNQKFDIVTMWDVVEHLREPARFLVRAGALLNPGGILVIKTPSIGEPCLRVVQRFPSLASTLLEAPDHVQFWTKPAMDTLLKRSGFRQVAYRPSRGFRSPAHGGSPMRKLKRKVKSALRQYGGNSNLYLSARLSIDLS